MDATPREADTIGVIELELLTLVRHLETFGRRSSLYMHIDRAGYLALRTLQTLGPVSATALAKTLHLDGSTVTRQIRALETGGFVERRPDPADGRSTTIVLTQEGRGVMGGVELERRRRVEGLVAEWSERDRADLGQTLRRLNGSLLENVADFDDGRASEVDELGVPGLAIATWAKH
jgi:DNA-binding MarR family transcriptional regulator